MQKYNDVVLRSNGSTSRPVAGATVTVTQFPSGAAATIYSDNGVTPITSLVSDATGAYAFYAADGRYNITVSGAGFTTKTLTDVLIEDPADGAVVSTGVSVTTKGDLQGFSSVAARIPVGTNNYVLTADSTQALGLKWAPTAAAGNSVTVSDTAPSSPLNGDKWVSGTSGIEYTWIDDGVGAAQWVQLGPSGAKALTCIPIACSDETTALTTGTAKVTFRMPFAFTLTAVRASLTTAQTSGSLLTVDLKEAGTTVFSTKPTINNTAKSTVGATTPAVLSDTSLADDAEMTVDITQIGDGTAKGLKLYLIGYIA